MVVGRRIIVGLLVLLVMLNVTPAFASSKVKRQEFHSQRPVNFVIQPGPNGCAQIRDPLTGTGKITFRGAIWTFADGSRRVLNIGTAEGTAVDPQGRTYRWHYQHRAVFTAPAGGTPVRVSMLDSFQVNGKTRANHINAQFDWSWTYVPADPSAVPSTDTMGFPPAVSDWVQRKTVGDPIHCDAV